MEILVLNGSPRPNRNISAMIEAFVDGTQQSGHKVSIVNVCQKRIAGCFACEYCRTKVNGVCIQKDDMQEVYPLLEKAVCLYQWGYWRDFISALKGIRYPVGDRRFVCWYTNLKMC